MTARLGGATKLAGDVAAAIKPKISFVFVVAAVGTGRAVLVAIRARQVE
jgi:hypothetical protein